MDSYHPRDSTYKPEVCIYSDIIQIREMRVHAVDLDKENSKSERTRKEQK